MNSENLPNLGECDFNPATQDAERTLSGGNRLPHVLVVGVMVLVLVLGSTGLPKGQGSGVASATPLFARADAAVTVTTPKAANNIATGFKTAPAAPEISDKVTLGIVAKAAVAPRPLVAALMAAPTAAAAIVLANVTITGKIKDENGRPLVGATVLLKGSSTGTSTDANGNYTLEVPGGTDNTLTYGYGGYDDEVVRAIGGKLINVTLTPRAKASRKRR